jgi:hypothetical protein
MTSKAYTAGFVVASTIASCPWWVAMATLAVIVFLHGAEPAMMWLDVLERIQEKLTRRTLNQVAAKLSEKAGKTVCRSRRKNT